MSENILTDMHCDTICELLSDEEKGLRPDIRHNNHHIDLEKLKESGYLLQNFALFTNKEEYPIPEARALKLYDMYCRMLEENKDILAPVLRYSDIEKNAKEGKISSLLTLEEGDVVFGDLAMLRNWHRMGVRMIALTWNYPNRIGSSNIIFQAGMDHKIPDMLQHINDKDGLTDFGIEYVREMERLGMIVDVSHLSDASFWDVMKYTTKPFVASHSNARAVCPAARNLSDDMILALHERGGVMGMNFCPDFLNEEPGGDMTIDILIEHIKYIKNLTGDVKCIGLGTDFDGISGNLEIRDASYMKRLKPALKKAGFHEEEIQDILGRNVLRVYREVLG